MPFSGGVKIEFSVVLKRELSGVRLPPLRIPEFFRKYLHHGKQVREWELFLQYNA